MSREYTYPHVDTTCPECKGDNILKDPFHQETYCTQCGLILSDTTISKITQVIEKEERRNHYLNEFWRETNKRIKLKEMRDIYKIID